MKHNEISIDTLIIGGGVLGLSTARAILKKFPKISLVLIDRHHKFGQETSSRNSEVIHAGFYYEPDTLKSTHCIRGKSLLYEYLKRRNIPYNNCGKYILAFHRNNESNLETYYQRGLDLQIPLQWVSQRELYSKLKIENIQNALWSPTTGIVDSHSFMLSLESEILELGGTILYSTQFLKTDLNNPNYIVVRQGEPSGNNIYKIDSATTINCSGLNCANVYKALNGTKDFSVIPCLGHYYSLASRFNGRFRSLVYPVPQNDGGLGIHITIDLSGTVRLGPDVEWRLNSKSVGNESYYIFNESEERKRKFFVQCQRYIPEVNYSDLTAGYVGARPKLFLNGSKFEDFYIEENAYRNRKVIHALGIESPGLTAALSLAEDLTKRV